MPSRYWVGDSGTWDATDTTHWSATSGGAGGASVPSSADDVIFDSNSFSIDNQLVDLVGDSNSVGRIFAKSIDFESVIRPFTLGNTIKQVRIFCYGSMKLSSSMTITNSAPKSKYFDIIPTGGSSIDLKPNGVNMGGNTNLRIGAEAVSNGTVYLQSPNLAVGAIIVIGSFNTQGNDLTTNFFWISTPSAETVRTIDISDSTITLIAVNISTTYNWQIIDSSKLNFISTGSEIIQKTTEGFQGGGLVYNKYTIDQTSPVSPSVILSSNTFSTLQVNPGGKLRLSSGAIQTVSNFVANGTSPSNITIDSTTAGVRHTISKPSGLVEGTYLNIKDSNATGGATWYARNSIDNGNNLGWDFSPDFPREAKGTLVLGGFANRTANAYKEAKGGLVLGGQAQSFIRKGTGQIEEKIYLAKVYDEDGTFLEVWKNDQISEPSFSQEINEIGSVMTLELARNSDSLATTTEPLQTESGTTITTESGLPLLASTQSRNQVGPGSAVNHNNRVDIFVFYGGVEPLLTELGEEILTEDGEVLLAVNGAPNGKRIFTGFISDINSRYGSTETTAIELSSYGWDLGQWPITTDTGDTTVPFNSYEPSEMVREAIDKFQDDSTGFGTFTTRTTTSISNTGTVTSYTFKVNTYEEVLQKAIELMPSGWYFYIGLGDNTVYFREKSEEPVHKFYLGEHIKDLELKSYIGDSTNRVIFTGGGDPALLKDYVETPASRTRRRLERISDGRVELESSAELISEGTIDEKNKVQYRTTVEILSKQYDIESINIGDMVGFRNFGSYVDTLVLQIVGLTYTPDIITLQLDTKIPSMNKRLEDIVRNLKVTENLSVPDAPS
jgi:hypothetical protein